MSDVNEWAVRLVQMDRRVRAAGLGLLLGLVAGLVGLGIALLGPVITLGGVLGLVVGLYILTDLEAALYAVLAVIGLLPFGTLPFRIGLTPTFLDMALGAFLAVYLFQWMTGRRRLFRMTPVHGLVVAFGLILLASFVMGLGHAVLTTNVLRQFAEMLLAIVAGLVLTDVIRDEAMLRRVMLVAVLIAGATALIGLGLYVLPDTTTEALLVRLAPLGYPNGGVVRYVEDNPALAERAIGVWVDPNAFGGVLAVLGALILPQVFAARPVGGRRWLALASRQGLALTSRRGLAVAAFGAVALCLLLTYSRGSMLALAAAAVFIALMRYRRLLLILMLAGLLILLLPVTQNYVGRFIEGFQGADRATQMRFGEINDALRLIGRYPAFGVGFSGTPERDIYLGVANLYLTMASNIGLVGLAVFLLAVAGLFLYGLGAWNRLGRPASLEPFWLGTHAGIVTALAAGVFDHYFFRLEFQASVTLFWLVFGLALTVSRLWRAAEAQ